MDDKGLQPSVRVYGSLDEAMAVARKEALEEAAKVCEKMVLRPAGYHGQWEGYGPFDGNKTGPECAIAIRALKETPCRP